MGARSELLRCEQHFPRYDLEKLRTRKACGHDRGYQCACHMQDVEREPMDVVEFMSRRGRANQVLPIGERLDQDDLDA